jgi:AraC family transcriptional regulator, transcriptional activator of pobA
MKNIPIRSIVPEGPKTADVDGFRIFNIREYLQGKDMIQHLHRHDFYFLLVLTKGFGVHEIDFVEHPIIDNSIFIMRPAQVHRFELKVGSEGYWLAFNKEFPLLSSATANALLRKAASRNFYKLNEKDIGALRPVLQMILEEYRSKRAGFEFIIKAGVEIFLIQFLRLQKKDGAAVVANQYPQEKLQELMDLLEANIGTTKQAAVYADMLSLSLFQLNSITKSLVGKTIAALIEDQILLEAKRHLMGTPNQVSQIAFQLGYDDVSYFIRFFKKKMGVTPDAFRKNFS